MPKHKSRAELLRELKEVDVFLKRKQSEKGGCFRTEDFAHLMRTPYGDTYKAAMESGRLSHQAFSLRVQKLKREGYFIYTQRKQGGAGWSVNPRYAATEGEGVVKTTILDKPANLKSKIHDASRYLNGLELITHLRNVAPMTTVGELYDMLKRFPEYEELCGQQDKSGETATNFQQELEQYQVRYAILCCLQDREQELRGVNLWQLYRVCQALDTPKPAAASRPEIVTSEPEIATDEDEVATSENDGSPF